MGDLLDFRAKVDFTQAKKDIAEFEKMVANLKVTSSGVSMTPASNGNWKKAQLEIQDMLVKTRKELSELKVAYQELKNKQEEGKISIQGITEAVAKEKLNQAELKTQLDQGKISRQVYNEMLLEGKVRQSEMDEAIKKQTLSDKEYTRQLKEKAQAEKENKAALKAAHNEYKAAAGSYDEANKKAQTLLKSIKASPGAFESQSVAVRTQIAEYIKLNDQLKAFDAGLGNHQREVGNYAKGFSGLSNSINQITRELPAFTFSAQTGFLALSNNIPILFDEIGKVNRALKETSIGSAQAAGDQARATALAGGASEEAADQVSELAKAQALQAAEGKRGIGMLKAIGSALFSWGTLLSVGVTLLTVYGKEISEWIGTLFKGKEAVDELARSQKILQDALVKGGQDGQAEATNLRVLYKLSQDNTLAIKKRKEAIDEMQKQWPQTFKNLSDETILSGKAKTAYDNLTQSIIATAKARAYQDVMAENAKRRFANDETIANAEIEYNKNITAARIAQNKIEGESARFYAREAEQAEEKRAEAARIIREAKKDNLILSERDLKLQQRITEQVVKGAKITDYNDPKSKTYKADAMLQKQLSLQAKIDELNFNASKRQLSQDEQEIASVKHKYDLIRQEIDKFYADKRNKDKKYKVDASTLQASMDLEIGVINYRVGTEELKADLEKKKSIYEDFESYRVELGKKAAEERFGSEIDTTKKYADVLQDEYEKILLAGSTVGFTAAMTERLKFLEKGIKEEGQIEQKRQYDLIKSIRTYEQEITVIEQDAKAERLALLGKMTKEQADIIDKREADRKAALGDAHLKELDAFKALYDGIDRLSDKNAKQVIGNAEDALSGLKAKGIVISKELEAELKLLFADSKAAIEDRMPTRLIDLANQIDNVADAVGGVDSAFGKVLGTLGNVIGQVGNIKKGIADLNKPGATGIEQLTAGLGIFGAGLSAAKGVFDLVEGLFNKAAKQQAEQAKRNNDLQLKHNNALNSVLERQVQLINEAFGIDKANAFNKARETAIENEKKYNDQLKDRYKITGDATADNLIEKANTGQSLGGSLQEQLFRELIKRGTIQKLGDLSGLSLEGLRQLAEGDKIDEGTKSILDNLIKSKEAIKNLDNQMRVSDIGSSIDDIANSFITDLTDGVDGFGKSIDETIEKSLMNGFRGEVIRKHLQGFYDEFAKLSADNGLLKDGASDRIEQLKALYSKAGEAARAELAELEKVTGIKLTVTPEIEKLDTSAYAGLISDLTNVTMKDGVVQLGNTITETISNAILEGFQAQMISEGLREFYAKIEEFQKGGTTITKEQVEGLKSEYAVFLTTYNDKLTALEQATGLSFRKLTETTTEAVVDGLSILGEGISRVLDSGEINAKAFADNFEGFIKNAVLEGLKSDIFADGLKGLNDKIKEFQKDGLPLTREQIAELRSDYGAFTDDILARLAVISEATGIQFDKVIEEQAAAIDSGFESLQDSVLSVFATLDGQTVDAGKKFEDVMKQAVLNSFKTQFLAGALKGFYDQLNSFTKDGEVLTSAQISSLRAQYDAMVALGMERMREFERVSGLSFSAPVEQVVADPLESSLAKGIKQITSEQASALEGITRGQYGLQKRMVELLTIQNGLLTGGGKSTSDLFNGARDNFGSVMKIEQNTAQTVQRLDLAIAELRAIRQSGGSLRGAGLA